MLIHLVHQLLEVRAGDDVRLTRVAWIWSSFATVSRSSRNFVSARRSA
jgi:hypothetical protein